MPPILFVISLQNGLWVRRNPGCCMMNLCYLHCRIAAGPPKASLCPSPVHPRAQCPPSPCVPSPCPVRPCLSPSLGAWCLERASILTHFNPHTLQSSVPLPSMPDSLPQCVIPFVLGLPAPLLSLIPVILGLAKKTNPTWGKIYANPKITFLSSPFSFVPSPC